MDSAELHFILKMRDEASAVLKGHVSSVNELGGAHKKLGADAEEASGRLGELVNKAKEAAEAFGAVWAASELNEKTIGAWSEMEVVLVRLREAAGVTKDAMGELQESIEGIAAHSLNQTNEQIGAVMRSAAQLGVQGVEGITKYTEVVSKLSTVTGQSTEAISNAMGQVLAATGETQDGAERFGNAFAVLADKTKGGAAALMQTAEQMTMMTAGMKLSATEVLGLSSAVDSLGLRSRSAGMAVSYTLTALANFAEKGGAQLGSLAVATGTTTAEFKKMVEQNPAKALELFLGALHRVQESGDSVQDFLKQFGLQGRQVEIALTAASKQVDLFKQRIQEAGSSDGALDKKLQPLLDTLTAQMHEITMTARDLGEALGQAFGPIVSGALGGAIAILKDIKAGFSALPPTLKEITAAIVIGLPMVVAATSAWRFLSEVVLAGLGTFRNMTGLLGVASKALQFFKAAETEAGIAASEMGVAAEAGGVAAVAGITKAEVAAKAATAAFAAMGAAVAKWGAYFLMAREAGVMIGGAINSADNDSMVGRARNAVADWRDTSKIGQSIKWVGNNVLGVQTPGDEEKKQQEDRQRQAHLEAMAEAHRSAEAAMSIEGEKSKTTDVDAGNVEAGVWASKVEKLDEYSKKLKEVQEQREAIHNLEKLPDAELEKLGLTKEQLGVMERIITQHERALDPMNKLRDSWAEQLRAAQAITKEQQNQVAIEKAIAEAARSNPHMTDADKAEMRANMEKAQAAERQKSFLEEISSLNDQLQLASAITQTEKDRLAVEQQIANLAKTKGYTDEELAVIKQKLELTKQIAAENAQMASLNPQAKAISEYNDQLSILNRRLEQGKITQAEFNRERTKLDNDTLSARDPIGAIVQSQKEEIVQLQITGQYRDADLKTLQQITTLKKQGLLADQATADAVEKQLSSYNRQVQDIQTLKGQFDSLTQSFSSGLSGAISGALQGQRGVWTKFAADIGSKMLDMGIQGLFKQALSSSGLEQSLFGGLFKQLNSTSDTLGKTAAGQVADTTKSLNAMTAAQVAITAGSVILNGGVTTGAGGPINGVAADGARFGGLGGEYAGVGAAANSNFAGSSGATVATSMLKQFEGYRANPYWDTNALRAGYGSDTKTDPVTGAVSRVQAGDVVTREMAEADLQRRVTTEFIPKLRGQVGGDVWDKLNPNQQGSLASIGYNSGSLPKDILSAVKGGDDSGAVEAAIRAHGSDNGGIRAKRREQEAETYGNPWQGQIEQAKQAQEQLKQVQRQSGQDQVQAARQASEQMTTASQTGFTTLSQDVRQAGDAAQTAGPKFQKVGQEAQASTPDMGKLGGSISGLAGQATAAIPGLGQFGGAISSLVTKLVSSAGSGGGGLFSGLGGLFGGLFHKGGVVGAGIPASGLRLVSSKTWAHAPRFHSGLKDDEYPAILQRGERVLTANDNARTQQVISGLADSISNMNHAAAARGQGAPASRPHLSQSMNMTVVAKDADSFRKSKSQIMSDMGVHMQRAAGRNG